MNANNSRKPGKRNKASKTPSGRKLKLKKTPGTNFRENENKIEIRFVIKEHKIHDLFRYLISSRLNGTETKTEKLFIDPGTITLNNFILLSPREILIMDLASSGKSNREISFEIGTKEFTVRNQLHKIYIKLGVTNRIAAVNKYRDLLSKEAIKIVS